MRHEDVPDVKGLALALASGRKQRDRMLVVSDHIMKFGRERAAGKLHRPGEVAQDRLHAAVSPRTSSSFGWVLLPASAGVAILRYRLYDIDRLINRTLVYGLLTASLGLGYAGAVLVLGHLFGGIRGEPPSWVVAGATLAVAALFQPARRRIQSIVDRRFNRRKIRRRQDGQGVQRPAPRPAGPGHALDRAPGGRRRDGPAGQGLDMASATVPGGFAQPRTSKLRNLSTILRRQAELFTESPPVSNWVG